MIIYERNLSDVEFEKGRGLLNCMELFLCTHTKGVNKFEYNAVFKSKFKLFLGVMISV